MYHKWGLIDCLPSMGVKMDCLTNINRGWDILYIINGGLDRLCTINGIGIDCVIQSGLG